MKRNISLQEYEYMYNKLYTIYQYIFNLYGKRIFINFKEAGHELSGILEPGYWWPRQSPYINGKILLCITQKNIYLDHYQKDDINIYISYILL